MDARIIFESEDNPNSPYDQEGFPRGIRRDAFTDAFMTAMHGPTITILKDYADEFLKIAHLINEAAWDFGRLSSLEVYGKRITAQDGRSRIGLTFSAHYDGRRIAYQRQFEAWDIVDVRGWNYLRQRAFFEMAVAAGRQYFPACTCTDDRLCEMGALHYKSLYMAKMNSTTYPDPYEERCRKEFAEHRHRAKVNLLFPPSMREL